MKLNNIFEGSGGNLNTTFRYSAQPGKTTNLLLTRLEKEVSKKSPESGKGLLKRIRTFRKKYEEEEYNVHTMTDMSDSERRDSSSTRDY